MKVAANVIRLPTAARRKVQQPCNKGSRLARQALREADPWTGQYAFPSIRDAARRLREFRALPPTPVTILVSGIIDATTVPDRRLLFDLIKVGVAGGDGLAIEAKTLFERVAGTSFGEHNDFVLALALDAAL